MFYIIIIIFSFNRIKQLNNLLRLFEENGTEMANTLALDLRKHKQEAYLTEIEYLKNEVKNYIFNLKEWAKPELVNIIHILILITFII